MNDDYKQALGLSLCHPKVLISNGRKIYYYLLPQVYALQILEKTELKREPRKQGICTFYAVNTSRCHKTF